MLKIFYGKLQEVIMGIKENDLEELILELLDKSPAIREKILKICSASYGSNIAVNTNAGQFSEQKMGLFDRKKISSLEAKIEQLKSQLNQLNSDYKRTYDKMQEYKNYSMQLKSECGKLENENSSLENEVSALKKEIKEVKLESERRLKDYERENENLKEVEKSLSSSLEKVNNSFKILKEHFFNPVTLLDRYKSLSISVRTGLSDIICDKNEILFIASCSTPDHLKAIWTYTKKLAGNNNDTTAVEVLKDIFDYFFDVFNESLGEPVYVRDDVETGWLFDDDEYDRYIGSATSGKITQVILRGYKSLNTGAVICRSLVRV